MCPHVLDFINIKTFCSEENIDKKSKVYRILLVCVYIVSSDATQKGCQEKEKETRKKGR